MPADSNGRPGPVSGPDPAAPAGAPAPAEGQAAGAVEGVRIAIVSDAWFPQVNGVVRTLNTTAGMLRERGHRVEVIGPDRFSTVPCPTYPEIRLVWRGAKKGIARAIEGFGAQAVHVATEGPLGHAARAYCRRRGLPFTTSFHTFFPDYLALRFGLPRTWSFAYLRRFHGAAEVTMISTPTMESILRRRGFRGLARWRRAVDTELFRPLERDFLEYPRPISLFVGRVAVEKNLEDFLKLDIPGTKVVVGDGPQRRDFEKRYPAVKFLGVKHGDELVRHYSAADVFVFPSRTDTLGLVQLEAMACGVPVAAYPVQGPLDVVTAPDLGALDEDLGQAVARALDGSRAACRAHALQFSWQRSADEFFANLRIVA
jgi:glycosyltransferase involved in cell wall biosynthesis